MARRPPLPDRTPPEPEPSDPDDAAPTDGVAPTDGARFDPPRRHRLTVEPSRLPGAGDGRPRALAAVAAVFGVIALTIASAWLTPSDRGHDRPGSSPRARGTGAPAAIAAASGSPESSPGAGIRGSDRTPWPAPPEPVVITPRQLAQGVADGSLDGDLIFVHGRLVPEQQACTQPLDLRCVTVSVVGLDLPIHTAPALVYWQAPSRGATLVMRPEAGHLVYLGVIETGIDAPTSMSELVGNESVAPRPITLSPVGGWLVIDPLATCSPSSEWIGCPLAGPFLADDQPLRSGVLVSTRGSEVGLESGAVGLGDGTTRLVGTFLVRRGYHNGCLGVIPSDDAAAGGGDASAGPGASPCTRAVLPGWDVVARLEGVRLLQITMPGTP